MPKIEYRTSKGKVPSVTTVINGNIGWSKNQLMYWAWNEGKEGRDYRQTSEKAMTAGSIAHAMIESELKNKPFAMPEVDKEIISKAESAFLNWLEWKDRVKFELVYSEISLVSEEYQFGGTIDFIPSINGKLSIFDFKTGSGIYEDHLLQIKAYQKLAFENGIDVTGGVHILLLGTEDASFRHFFFQAIPEAWEAFLCALKLHNLHKALKKMV